MVVAVVDLEVQLLSAERRLLDTLQVFGSVVGLWPRAQSGTPDTLVRASPRIGVRMPPLDHGKGGPPADVVDILGMSAVRPLLLLRLELLLLLLLVAPAPKKKKRRRRPSRSRPWGSTSARRGVDPGSSRSPPCGRCSWPAPDRHRSPTPRDHWSSQGATCPAPGWILGHHWPVKHVRAGRRTETS